MITYSDIRDANEQIRTTDIKGKKYAEVNQRIKAFRMVYPLGGIVTHMLENAPRDGKNNTCIIRAIVTDDTGRELGTGTAYEVEGNSFINKTSYIENCETSAVGRALGMAGFGIDANVASADEVENALQQQELLKPITKVQEKTFIDLCNELNVDYKEIGKKAGASSLKTMSNAEHGKCMILLKEIEEEQENEKHNSK